MKKNLLIIEPPVKDADVKEANINLHLAPILLKYTNKILDLKKSDSFKSKQIVLNEDGYLLAPEEYVLGSTIQKVCIPSGYFGFIETKGNIARAGIQIHNTDGHIDPGFCGNITLEIKNNSNSSIRIYPHIAVAQLYIFKLTSKSSKLYDGKYQNQKGATTYIPDYE